MRVFLTAATLVLAGTAVAFAHAELKRATPSAGSTISTAPSELTATFSEALEVFSKVVVSDSTGKQVDKADKRIEGTTIRVSLQPLPSGIYTVKWRAVTVDTHHTEGTFIFTVGP